MTGSDFVELADKLVGTGPAGARSATSRAYYGAFHLATQVLRDVATAPPGNARQHMLTPEYIMSVNEKKWMDLGRDIKDLYAARLKADYELADTSVESRSYAKLNVEAARDIESRLSEFKAACLGDQQLLQKLKAGIFNCR